MSYVQPNIIIYYISLNFIISTEYILKNSFNTTSMETDRFFMVLVQMNKASIYL